MKVFDELNIGDIMYNVANFYTVEALKITDIDNSVGCDMWIECDILNKPGVCYDIEIKIENKYKSIDACVNGREWICADYYSVIKCLKDRIKDIEGQIQYCEKIYKPRKDKIKKILEENE